MREDMIVDVTRAINKKGTSLESRDKEQRSSADRGSSGVSVTKD